MEDKNNLKKLKISKFANFKEYYVLHTFFFKAPFK